MSEQPSAWLVDNLDLIPKGVRVLDVACGRGRHALYLAEAGWSVHAVDRRRDALAALEGAAAARNLAITTECIDLEHGEPSLGRGRYGAVVVFNYLHRALMPAIVAAVAPRGVLIYETFTREQARRGQPTNPAFLLEAGELPRLVAPLVVIRAREGDFDGKLVSAVVATGG